MTAGTPVRVATYCRISTDETNQPYSLGAQRDRLDAYVASQPEWRIVERYVDRASGKSLERPDLTAARAAAAAGAFDLLLVYRVDRLSRNLAQLGTLIEELQRVGVAFRSATEPFDTATPAGLMMMQMLGVFAQFERSSIVERIAAGMERKAKGGGWTVGTYPYGYHKLNGTPGLVADPVAAPVVREIFRRYAEDRQGSAAIAAELNARGLRTRYGGPWSRTAVLDVLRNRVYLGEVPFRGVWYIGNHEPLVDQALFEAAVAILARRAADHGTRRRDGSDYLLSGLPMVCDRCGHRLIGAAARGRGGKRYAYYTCYSRSRYGQSGCDLPRLRKDELEEAILGQMSTVYADTSLIGAALAEMEAEMRRFGAAHDERRAALDAEAVELRTRIDRYFASFEAGQLSPELCQARVAGLQARIQAIEDERAAIVDAAAGPPLGPDEIALISWSLSEALGGILRQAPTPRTKALLGLLIEEIRVVSPTDIRPTYRVPTTVPTATASGAAAEEGAVRNQDEMVEMRGLEPLTPAMRTRCSPS